MKTGAITIVLSMVLAGGLQAQQHEHSRQSVSEMPNGQTMMRMSDGMMMCQHMMKMMRDSSAGGMMGADAAAAMGAQNNMMGGQIQRNMEGNMVVGSKMPGMNSMRFSPAMVLAMSDSIGLTERQESAIVQLRDRMAEYMSEMSESVSELLTPEQRHMLPSCVNMMPMHGDSEDDGSQADHGHGNG